MKFLSLVLYPFMHNIYIDLILMIMSNLLDDDDWGSQFNQVVKKIIIFNNNFKIIIIIIKWTLVCVYVYFVNLLFKVIWYNWLIEVIWSFSFSLPLPLPSLIIFSSLFDRQILISLKYIKMLLSHLPFLSIWLFFSN